jgi:hypothetical protein
MSDLSLYLKISLLPDSLKSEINDYIDFLREKKLKKKVTSQKHPKAGCMKGTFKMSPDFDEPLEDFKEYMES